MLVEIHRQCNRFLRLFVLIYYQQSRSVVNYFHLHHLMAFAAKGLGQRSTWTEGLS